MKKLFALLMPLFLVAFFAQPVSAGYAGGVSPKFEPVKQTTTVAKETKTANFAQKVVNFVSKPFKGAADKKLVAILLCFFLGGLGIHRVYLGASGKLILFYFLLSLIGIGGLLALIDLVALIVAGTGPFDGNDKLLACFDAF